MTYTVPLHNTMSKEGVDLSATYTIYDQTAAQSDTNSPANPAPPFTLGETVESSNGGEFMFVKASAAINQYDFVGILTTYNASQLTSTTAATAPIVGIAQTAIASGSAGWVCLRGGSISGNVVLSTATGVALYPTTVPGFLSATTLVAKVDGVVCTTSRATTNGSTAVLASYPTITLY